MYEAVREDSTPSQLITRVYIYIHTYTHIHTHIHAHIRTYIQQAYVHAITGNNAFQEKPFWSNEQRLAGAHFTCISP